MPIEVSCKGCQARYKVKEELAGRTVECKHCGQKFRVPYRSAVVRLGDEDEVLTPATSSRSGSHPAQRSKTSAKPSPADDDGQRSFAEYGLDPDDPSAPIMKRKKERPKIADGILPELVADLWLPLGLMVATYGITLYVALMAMLRSNGPLAGCILLGIVVAMFFALVIPMTMRMLEGASKTLDFEAPNAMWLQTAGCIGLPTMGLVVGGLGVGSIGAMIAFGLIGFVVMCPLMALMFRIDFLKGAQAAVLGALFYLMSVAMTAGVIAAVGLWLMPLWKITRPWDEKPEVVATKAEAPAPVAEAPKEEPAAAPVAVASATPDKPKIEEVVTPKGTAKPGDVWEVPIDAGTPVRWPGEVAHVLNVRPPVQVLETSPTEPYVAVVDAEATKVFDLRNGKRVGVVNEKARDRQGAISEDGAFIAFEVVQTSGIVPPSIEVWSVPDGRMAVRIPSNGNVRALGFDASGRVYVLNHEGGKPVVQGWDARTRRQVSTTPLEGMGTLAVSANGRLLANLTASQLRVYDIQEGRLVGQKPIELAFRQIGDVAFSPDGKKLAACVLGDGGAVQAPRIVVWDMVDGAMAAPMQPVAVDSAASLDRMEMTWLPDSEGFLLDGTLVDRLTGKTLQVPKPPSAGNAVGKPRVALSNFSVLYEIAPAGNSEKLIFRAASSPKAEVMATIKSIRGDDWVPEADPEPAAPAALAGGDPAAGATAAAAAVAPTTKPINPATMKEWVVEVQAVIAADGPSIERQLRAEQKKLEPLDAKHRELQERATYLSSSYITNTDSFGRVTRTPRFSLREITEAKGAAKKALEEVRDVKIVIARLNRELKGVTTQRIVTGTLVDLNIPVTMNVDGVALVALVDPLQPGAKVKVTGGPLFEKGMLTIKLRSLTVVE